MFIISSNRLIIVTGLYYYGARYYDPGIGRFTQADTIVQSPYDPQTLNRYSYCRNNPINYVDPTGHDWIVQLITWIIVMAVGYGLGQTGHADVDVGGKISIPFESGPSTSRPPSYTTPSSPGGGGPSPRYQGSPSETGDFLGQVSPEQLVAMLGWRGLCSWRDREREEKKEPAQRKVDDLTNIYGKFTVRVKRRTTAQELGHAWITLQKNKSNPFSYGFGPIGTVNKLQLINGAPGKLARVIKLKRE